MKFGIAIITAVALSFTAVPASAQDSVRMPGDITTDQCPVGFQYSRGIEVNVTTHEYFTWCNAAPNQADLMIRSWDEQFRLAQQDAEAVALEVSKAWNEAHPGEQKCVSWGPLKHPSGVGEASGGVCANPVDKPVVGTPVVATKPVLEDAKAQVAQVKKAVKKPVKKVVKKKPKKKAKKK